MLVGSLRFFLPAILEGELSFSVVGNSAGATTEEIEVTPEPSGASIDHLLRHVKYL